MRIHAALLCLTTVLLAAACDNEKCNKCTDCPDFTGKYQVMLSASEDTCEGTAYESGNTEISALSPGQIDCWLSEQGEESIHMRIIQQDIILELDGVLCVGEDDGSYRLQLNGTDNTFSEVSAFVNFQGKMVDPAADVDGGVSGSFNLEGFLTIDYINNIDANGSCRLMGVVTDLSF